MTTNPFEGRLVRQPFKEGLCDGNQEAPPKGGASCC